MSIRENKVAIVTGAAQGIGAAYARGLAAAGAAVTICDVLITPRRFLRDISDAVGRAFGKIVDITKSDQVRDFGALTSEALGAPKFWSIMPACLRLLHSNPCSKSNPRIGTGLCL